MDDERPEDRDDHPEWVIRGRGRIIDAAAFGQLVKRFGRPDGTIDAKPKDAR
jgi:hypothetical protein